MDPKAHLLRTVDWMDTHNVSEDLKVRRFPIIKQVKLNYCTNPHIHFKVMWGNYRRGLELSFLR